MFHFLSKIVIGTLALIGAAFGFGGTKNKVYTPTPSITQVSNVQQAPTPIITLTPGGKPTSHIPKPTTPLPTLIPVATPVSHLLDDPDTANFLTGQLQSIQVINGVIQKWQNGIFSSQAWIKNANALLPTLAQNYAQTLMSILQENEEYINLLQSSIASGNRLIQLKQEIITALQNDDSQTLLKDRDLLPTQTAIFTGLANQINQMGAKIYAEQQNLINLMAKQITPSIPSYAPTITPFQIPTLTPIPVATPKCSEQYIIQWMKNHRMDYPLQCL